MKKIIIMTMVASFAMVVSTSAQSKVFQKYTITEQMSLIYDTNWQLIGYYDEAEQELHKGEEFPFPCFLKIGPIYDKELGVNYIGSTGHPFDVGEGSFYTTKNKTRDGWYLIIYNKKQRTAKIFLAMHNLDELTLVSVEGNSYFFKLVK